MHSKEKEEYLSSWICRTPNGAARYRDVLILKDADSYQEVTDTLRRRTTLRKSDRGVAARA